MKKKVYRERRALEVTEDPNAGNVEIKAVKTIKNYKKVNKKVDK